MSGTLKPLLLTRRLREKLAITAFLFVGMAASVTRAETPAQRGQAIADAITELDVERARALLEAESTTTDALAFQRARLAVYMADCDTAEAVLARLPPAPHVNSLTDLARNCARAVSGALIVEDKSSGIWIRLQDDADRVLVPAIVSVAVRARGVLERDLGVELPRPLRIDLVRDLFSLSSVSGLPVSAAETTGTVAVARWGRVTMLSPRATSTGYPWQDTLTHELTHLSLSRATRDYAPLWLQEGVAKGEETRWRDPQPFDNVPPPDQVARDALVNGTSVGVDALGPSIAMLPSADAASTAFAEVTSFVSFFIARQGRPAFHLFLRDLKGLAQPDANAALVSVTGFDLKYWIQLWQSHLLEKVAKPSQAKPMAESKKTALSPRDFPRHLRLGALFFDAERFRVAASEFEQALKFEPTQPSLRFDAARSALGDGDSARAQAALGGLEQIADLHGGWFALHGRFLRERGEGAAAATAFDLAFSVDPIAEEVACEGTSRRINAGRALTPPTDPVRRELCSAYMQ